MSFVMKKFTTNILASNHATLIMGMLSLLPPWTIDFAAITNKQNP